MSGVTRGTVYLVSQSEGGRPNYGGTPSDQSILQAISSLKSRGYKVTLYPFILMDVPTGDGLLDPYDGAEQEAFPWRGRITCHPRVSENTSAVNAQINRFFGIAQRSHFDAEYGVPNYTGPDEFSYRRFILHYAKLAQISGGVDRFAIGSEMVGLTTLRGVNNSYPAVQKLVDLAADVKAILPAQTALTYAADWSEYFGHHPSDGSGDITFHLDPLWSSSAIDAIGIDAYFPLSDWRDGEAHLDTDIAEDNYDLSYLKSQMEGGEGYDYFYPSQADRDMQNRSPITDGGADKPWVFRYKDLRNWWSQPHYNRRGESELNSSTNWVPESKPIWLMEIGCPAIDKGANQPNIFFDAKSSQSNFPYYSNASRDDLMQRRYLEAFINYWSEGSGNNPQSSLYNASMIDMDMINLWAWDGRPFPDFPARSTVWSDGENWQRGHWLSGRIGLVPLADVVEGICNGSGLENVDASKVTGLVQGYRLDRPMTGRAALTPLSLTYGFNVTETAKGLRFASIGTETNLTLSAADIVDDLSASIGQIKATPEDRLRDARIHFIDAGNDYQLGLVSARDRAAETVRILDVNAPIVMDKSFAKLTADRLLARQIQSDRILNFQLSETRLDIEVGDLITLPDIDALWQVETLEGLTTQRVEARLTGDRATLPNTGPTPEVTGTPQWTAKPNIFALDLPGDYSGPLIGIGLDPFSVTEVQGPDGTVIIESPARIGALLTELPRGPMGRWDMTHDIEIFLPNVALSSLSDDAIFEGGNRFAVETETGWEIIQAANATLIAPSTYHLSRLLRGQNGSDADMQDTIPSGARIVWLGAGWQDLPVPDSLIGETVPIVARAAGLDSDTLHHPYIATHLRPLSPVHVKIRDENGQIHINWIRRTRTGGDSWAGLDVPLGEETELYRVQLWAEGVVIAEYEVTEPKLTLPSLENADSVSIAQASRAFGWGVAATLAL